MAEMKPAVIGPKWTAQEKELGLGLDREAEWWCDIFHPAAH